VYVADVLAIGVLFFFCLSNLTEARWWCRVLLMMDPAVSRVGKRSVALVVLVTAAVDIVYVFSTDQEGVTKHIGSLMEKCDAER
jgi:hypothetical protein